MHTFRKYLVLSLFTIIILTACNKAAVDLSDPVQSDAAAGLIEKNDFECEGVDIIKGGVPVEVHKLNDYRCYPVGIFENPTPPDECDFDHFHYTLVSLDGVYRRNEDDPDCGAATTFNIIHTGTYYISHELATEWNELWRQQGISPASIDFIE